MSREFSQGAAERDIRLILALMFCVAVAFGFGGAALTFFIFKAHQ